jgi:uncharacterized protein
MTRTAIVDTGPLFAYLSPSDAHHVWAREQFERYAAPLLTCEPVLSEAMFLLRRRTSAPPALVLEMVQAGVLSIAIALPDHLDAVRGLCARYGARMSLADACLVRLSELHPEADVLTTDRADFDVYRRHRHQPVPFVAP